jgi:DNA excision repair protein ERCC-2
MPGMFCDRCKSIMTPVGDRLVCRQCGMTRSRDGGAGTGGDRGPSNKPKFQTRLAGTREERQEEEHEETGPPANPDPNSIFPYLPRPHQMDFVELIGEVLESRGNLVVESGTGTGKTVCALSGTVEYALANDKRIVYITRTNSQATIAIKELRAISKRRNVLGISLQGRRNNCPMLSELSVDNLTPGELSRVCEHKKKNTRDGVKGGCTYYANTVHLGHSYFKNYCADNIPTSDELSRFCETDGACPYEVGKMLMPEAKVVIAPYPYIISSEVRHHFLEQLQAEADDLILVVDEAHNLADAARDAESIRITKKIVSIVTVEAGEMGNAKLSKEVDLKKFAGALFSVLDRAAELCAESGKDEVALGRGFLEGTLCEALGCDRGELAEIVAEMQATGEEMAQRRLQSGREPTSATFTLGRDLTNWVASDNARYVRRATMEEGGMIEAYCLDPKGALSFFHEVHGSVHMSGTLRPLDQYVRVCGLGENTKTAIFDSPFPKENRKVLFVEDVETKYESRSDPNAVQKLHDHVSDLANAVPRNTMIFFPSHAMLHNYLYRNERLLTKKVYREVQGESQEKLVADIGRFKRDSRKGAVFFAVMGGRVSEGLDFPFEELQMVVIVGIPYPKPSLCQERLREFYDQRFGGKGFEYAVNVPAARRMMQSIGRLIRTEKDVGCAVVLDSRAPRFTKYLEMERTDDPVSDVKRFFLEHPGR